MRNDRTVSVLRDACALIIPIIAAVLLAYQLSFHDQRNRAQLIADVVLNRSEHTTDQLASAFQRMAVFEPAQACSKEAMTLMREVDLSSSLLQGVGFVANNQLQCSSLGAAGLIEVGAPDYVSATGAIIRRQRELSIAPDTPLLLITGQSGYSGLIHPALIFSLIGEGDDLPAGTVSYSTRETILYSGPGTFDWSGAAMPADQSAGTLVMGDRLLAWQRSSRWDQFAYAAIPLAAVSEEFLASVGFYLAAGAVAGLAILAAARWLAANQTSLPALLRAGLARGELHTVYQPIVDMRTGRWLGAEVLTRWQRRSGEWIPPDVFVPIAEKHGLIRQLTRHVMVSCADDLKMFITMDPDFFVSINITSVDLQDHDFIKRLIAECAKRGIEHRRVHLEITERVQVDTTLEAETIKALREQGFEVGIDDFGIGYSNLAYLDTLKVDYLKIDKTFVAGISNGMIGTAVVDHIIALGAERDLKVIAEGVEEEDQRAALVSRGVWLGQGWLFARPMSAANFIASYAKVMSTTPSEPPRPLARVA